MAYDIDYGQQQQQDGMENQKPLERGINVNEDENDDQHMDADENNEITLKNNDSRNDLNKTTEETNDENEEQMIEGEYIMTLNAANREESSFHTATTNDLEQSMMEIEKQHSLVVPVDDTTLPSEMIANELLLESEKRIEPLLYELCNQLQLVLEPTKRSKYKGDFKTGKRLNMRKVIAYVASQFRKDKIWLRRVKPSKRQYQILIAIDDSLSMSDNQSRMMAFDSLILLGKSLSIIESGLLSVVSFGEETRVVHSFGDPFTDQTIIKIFNKVWFSYQKCLFC
ncbi:hypothetical protein BLA29_005325 [Euroglyphus maynei]|uniref:Midasin-like protein n=1 Tax=Euroglyphus maynei TaxID=6958 RepID=A0A1Y3BTR6_EURMA|nr:hypothetical protein BLA29_005325 [Euroglyphus maynei]